MSDFIYFSPTIYKKVIVCKGLDIGEYLKHGDIDKSRLFAKFYIREDGFNLYNDTINRFAHMYPPEKFDNLEIEECIQGYMKGLFKKANYVWSQGSADRKLSNYDGNAINKVVYMPVSYFKDDEVRDFLEDIL